jgi:hypothetical protein
MKIILPDGSLAIHRWPIIYIWEKEFITWTGNGHLIEGDNAGI